MMYSEFIEMSGNSESYISFKEYTEEIEPIEDKLTYIHSECSDIENHIKLVDLQARKLAYQYMRLYLGV